MIPTNDRVIAGLSVGRFHGAEALALLADQTQVGSAAICDGGNIRVLRCCRCGLREAPMAEQDNTLARADKPSGARLPTYWPSSDAKLDRVMGTKARGIEMKADPNISPRGRQSAKIREIADSLTATGYRFLDAQARALGLPRSTTWKIRQADHKHSGLSAAVINRILAQPQLPPLVRTTIIEYVEAKSAGMYGHNDIQLRRFSARLSACLA